MWRAATSLRTYRKLAALFDDLVGAGEQRSRHVECTTTDFGWGFHCHLLVIVEKPIVAYKSHDLEMKSLRV